MNRRRRGAESAFTSASPALYPTADNITPDPPSPPPSPPRAQSPPGGAGRPLGGKHRMAWKPIVAGVDASPQAATAAAFAWRIAQAANTECFFVHGRPPLLPAGGE